VWSTAEVDEKNIPELRELRDELVDSQEKHDAQLAEDLVWRNGAIVDAVTDDSSMKSTVLGLPAAMSSTPIGSIITPATNANDGGDGANDGGGAANHGGANHHRRRS
jgi:hypothetical protein